MTRPLPEEEQRVLLFNIERFAYAPFGTYGRCTVRFVADPIPTLKQWWTVERPWINNRRNISCIPEGSYKARRELFHRGNQETIELEDVGGRSEILLHSANWPDEVQGCIGIGTGLLALSGGDGHSGGIWGVAKSRNAMEELQDVVYQRYANLQIAVSIYNCMATSE